MKLDLGCGKNKAPGFVGVDSLQLEGVDVVTDLKQPWPWADGEVEEVHCSHFLEHLTNPERVHFANELFRVLKVGGQARIICPHASNDCAYGDPTHQWPPVTGWAFLYWHKQWREANAPHADFATSGWGYNCDFDHVVAASFEQWLATRNDEFRMHAMSYYRNASRDIIVTLTKRG